MDDFYEIIENVWKYSQDNPVVAIPIALVILYLLFRKPKLLIGLVFIGLAIYGVMQLLAMLSSSTGLEHKKIPFVDK